MHAGDAAGRQTNGSNRAVALKPPCENTACEWNERSFRHRAELSVLGEEKGRRSATGGNYRGNGERSRWLKKENMSASLITGGWTEYGVEQGGRTEVSVAGTMVVLRREHALGRA